MPILFGDNENVRFSGNPGLILNASRWMILFELRSWNTEVHSTLQNGFATTEDVNVRVSVLSFGRLRYSLSA